jgi:hypothetical protein
VSEKRSELLHKFLKSYYRQEGDGGRQQIDQIGNWGGGGDGRIVEFEIEMKLLLRRLIFPNGRGRVKKLSRSEPIEETVIK